MHLSVLAAEERLDVPYVEKDKLFLSHPAVCREYTDHRQLDGIAYECYKQLRQRYTAGEQQVPSELDTERLFFPDEPCRLAATLIRSKPDREPDYLICCYDSYQLTNYISPALYIQHALGFYRSESFSVADMGVFAPLLALEWVRATRSEALMVCMEQVYDRIESWEGRRYPRADALAMLSVSTRQGAYQVICYEQQLVDPAGRGEDGSIDDKTLARAACQLIDTELVRLQLPIRDVTVVVPGYSERYEQAFSRRYPHVYRRSDRRNLATADGFYSLEAISGTASAANPYVLLSLADPRGSVGMLLLRSMLPPQKGGEDGLL
ncbi:hypothetical protein LOK74_08010 [Brevibacillus humidisoli]|uniref:hypothetical protein n=1 Tax=Brevibacillus humidisoli TaxID=2895522 RepID=UPI001E3057D0|nr:hypothetical protein [Brevibacillus humidisoli]UFJ42419.1 hypothetical protein LOK74_08010 [Brevibacillus humidisoli]